MNNEIEIGQLFWKVTPPGNSYAKQVGTIVTEVTDTEIVCELVEESLSLMRFDRETRRCNDPEFADQFLIHV